MHDIEMHEASPEFAQCFQAAGRHLLTQAQGVELSWLKADLRPPFLEHLSFRIGNQLFFIRLEEVGRQLATPGGPQGLTSIADGCNGHACLMEMRYTTHGWRPENPGWGLTDIKTGRSINPAELVSDEKIEMTDWELHDFAVQQVRHFAVEKEGKQLMSFCGNPGVDPSIWFIGENGPEWIVVRAVRFPENKAAIPDNINNIASSCCKLSNVGHFASVAFAGAYSKYDPENPEPLWRGYGMHANFSGLQSLAGII
jgi:hypothetical protein